METLEKLREELERLRAEEKRREQKIANQEMDLEECFVTRWATRLNIELVQAKIEILENGGLAEFPALYDLEGNLVCDRTVKTRYGKAFPVEREGGTEWVGCGLKPQTYEKKGYRLGTVKKPAWAYIEGNGGTGLAGAHACYVKIFPADVNYAE